jgi:hypothetical protein
MDAANTNSMNFIRTLSVKHVTLIVEDLQCYLLSL